MPRSHRRPTVRTFHLSGQERVVIALYRSAPAWIRKAVGALLVNSWANDEETNRRYDVAARQMRVNSLTVATFDAAVLGRAPRGKAVHDAA